MTENTTTNTSEQPPPLTSAQDLRLAARLVESVLTRLNHSSTRCDGCGRRHYKDFREANAYDQLQGMSAKLRRWADAIETPEQYNDRGEKLDSPQRRGRR